MTRTRWLVSVVVVLVGPGCAGDGEKAPNKAAEKPAEEAATALRVEVGDCAAGTEVTFVSGPQPVLPDAEAGGGAFASLTGTGDISSGVDDRDVYGGLLGNEVDEMQGGFGFGRTGTEPGGGTGVPQVSIGSANASGDLDKDTIRRYIRRKLPRIRYCYEKQLLVKPKLAGRVDTKFVIDAGGVVTSASATGMDPEVASCIGDAIKSLQFPKPKGGGLVRVNYPFMFRPAGGGDETPPSEPAKEPARRQGQYRMKANPIDPQLAKQQAIDQARAAGVLGSAALARDPSAAPAAPYRPGAQSPLRGHEPMLATCLRKQPSPHGVAVIELDIDAAGAVKSSSVHGVGGEVPACVAAAVKQITVRGASPGVQRCPVAFGVTPAGEARGVDLTATAVMVNGKRVVDVADIAADPDMAHRIDPLYQVIRSQVEETGAAPVVSVRGPIVLRAIDEAPMKVVTRALVTLAMAGTDYLLAVQQGTGWRLLDAVDLPVVPVAVGTGSWWSPGHRRVARVSILSSSDSPPIASVLVSKDAIWIGTSRSAAEPVTIPAGPDQQAKLEEALRTRKQSPAFAARRDIEIAAEDDAQYRQLVAAIDAASKAGFTDWTLTTSESLTSVPPR